MSQGYNTASSARPGVESIDVDVLVAGGGPAGLGAALGAARLGAKTLLVERMAFLGGVGAVGLGMTINQMRPGEKPRSNVHEALIKQVQAFGDVAVRIEEHALITNTEYLKVAAFKALEEAGCDYLLYAFVSDAIVVDGVVKGAIVSTKSGPLQINAKRVVDSTGDADVVYFAGGQTAKGRETDGFLSPMTSLFVIGGVDLDRARPYYREPAVLTHLKHDRSPWQQLFEEGRKAGYEVPLTVDVTLSVYPGCLVVNHSGTRQYGVLDGTSSRDLTRAERLMRQQAVDVVRLLKDRKIPGFERAYLEQVSAWAGVRETRRIVGGYVLTQEDAKTGARFPDSIAQRFGWLDVGFVHIEAMAPHDVPYRSLVPNGVENVLASGRNISTTHVAMSAGKSMGNCMATGHAAGAAAALSIREGVTPRALDVKLLQRTLHEEGVPRDALGG